MSKKIDVGALSPIIGTMYPPPYDEPCLTRSRTKLGDAAGLTQFGVNLLRLSPGAWSSQRHWQTASDEFVYVISREVHLVTDGGAEILRPGDCAGFKAGDAAHYSEADMFAPPGGKPAMYTRKDGTPYTDIKRRVKRT